MAQKQRYPFADNWDRLLGLHRLTAFQAAHLLGVSKTTVSGWRNAHKTPNLESVTKLADLFEVDAMRLVYSPFTELIENELADVERFRRVEEKLRKSAMRPGLPKAVRLSEVGKHPKT